ncbi:MAG: thermonuclease family protein, partial [Pseudomonadota bacterium]
FVRATAGAVLAAMVGATAYSYALPDGGAASGQKPVAIDGSSNAFAHLSWPELPALPSLPSASSLNPFSSAASVVKGRARVLSGDTLVVDGQTLKLSGIEAPEQGQTCRRPGARRWRCGVAAERALQRLVRRRTVACSLGGTTSLDVQVATCAVNGNDLAASLVKGGHVFAEPGFFASYTSLERQAKDDKKGMWRGQPERPDAFRSVRWERALKRSPDGCPIKGRADRRRGKIYVVPWSVSYDRYRVKERRGDRWFCSEQEAFDAGWKPLERS